MSATRVAAIDCGTNTIKLLVADLDPGSADGSSNGPSKGAGTAVEVVREMRMVRLGQGVDRTGRLSEAALARVFDAIDEYAVTIGGLDVARTRFCATSAARDADNADEFADGVRERLGIEPEVVPGDEEARLSYDGATRSLGPGLAGDPPYLVLDIGGGSTELILGDGTGAVLAAQSLDIGSVRLTERHLSDDPPTHEQVAAAIADIDAALDGCTVDPSRARAVIGVAGTVTTVAAAVLDLASYDRTLLHHAVVATAGVQAQASRLLAMTIEQRRALGFMHPGRADVIGAGALILDRVLRRTPVASMLVSESDILDGIAWSMV